MAAFTVCSRCVEALVTHSHVQFEHVCSFEFAQLTDILTWPLYADGAALVMSSIQVEAINEACCQGRHGVDRRLTALRFDVSAVLTPSLHQPRVSSGLKNDHKVSF